MDERDKKEDFLDLLRNKEYCVSKVYSENQNTFYQRLSRSKLRLDPKRNSDLLCNYLIDFLKKIKIVKYYELF